MREIVLDTETTGISSRDGHRIIEIGAVEMVNFSVTGRSLHLYINPERDIEDGAQNIHGLSSEFLADKPVFADILTKFTEFIKDDLPALGLPITASSGTLDTIRSSLGSFSTSKSKNSPVPDPFIDDKQNKYSKPRV